MNLSVLVICVSQNNHMEFHCCLQDWNWIGKCKYWIYVKLFHLYASYYWIGNMWRLFIIKRTEIKRKREYCDKNVCLKWNDNVLHDKICNGFMNDLFELRKSTNSMLSHFIVRKNSIICLHQTDCSNHGIRTGNVQLWKYW